MICSPVILVCETRHYSATAQRAMLTSLDVRSGRCAGFLQSERKEQNCMRRLSFGGAFTLIMALALVGCGSRATTQISATATTPASMTTTPAATSGSFAPTLATVAPAPTSHAGSFAACGQSFTSSSTVGVPVSLLDGMTVTASTPLGNLAMPQTRIPNGTPLAPYKLDPGPGRPAPRIAVGPRRDRRDGGRRR